MRGKPGYEHLNEPLHILVEAELPVEIVDARLMQAREILEDLLKPIVSNLIPICPFVDFTFLFCHIIVEQFVQEGSLDSRFYEVFENKK